MLKQSKRHTVLVKPTLVKEQEVQTPFFHLIDEFQVALVEPLLVIEEPNLLFIFNGWDFLFNLRKVI